MKLIQWALLLGVVTAGAALLRCTTVALPIKAAAEDVVTKCPLDITVRECLHNLIDDVAHHAASDAGAKE